jgi:molybdopterin/thiamine biosynthesis adenylyltransferase
MGHEAQGRMVASKALLAGCSVLGIEIAKNSCILAGINLSEPQSQHHLGPVLHRVIDY